MPAGEMKSILTPSFFIIKLKLFKETVKIKWQDKLPDTDAMHEEDSRDAKHTYSIKASTDKMDWSCSA